MLLLRQVRNFAVRKCGREGDYRVVSPAWLAATRVRHSS